MNDYLKECYRGLIRRCYDKTHKSYENYGGRGITVSNEWLESYDTFCNDMGERPKGFSIERIDVNLGYCKENCKWASAREQANNKRNTIIINAFGIEKPLSYFLEDYGIASSTFHNRVYKMGWDVETALITEPQGLLFINGETKKIGEWCREFGISINTYKNRVSIGWSKEDAIKTPSKWSGKNGRN